MFAVTKLFAVLLVVACGQLVSSLPAGGEIVLPGANTYTIGEGKDTKVEVRRVPANLYSEKSTDSPNATLSFGALTERSTVAV